MASKARRFIRTVLPATRSASSSTPPIRDKPVTDHSFNSFTGFTPLTPAFNTPANPHASDPNGDGVPGSFIADFRYQNLEETRERIGGNAAIQWRPSDAVELYGDMVYSHLTTDRQRDWFSVPLSSNAADYLNYTLSDREILVSGTTSQFAQTNAERLRVKSDSISGALGMVWKPSDRFTVRPEFNYSYANLNNTQTFVRMQTVSRYPIGFDLTGSAVPQLTLPAGLDLTDPTLFRYSNIFDSEFKTNARETAGRLDFNFNVDSGLLSKIDAGLKYADLETVKNSYPVAADVESGDTRPVGPRHRSPGQPVFDTEFSGPAERTSPLCRAVYRRGTVWRRQSVRLPTDHTVTVHPQDVRSAAELRDQREDDGGLCEGRLQDRARLAAFVRQYRPALHRHRTDRDRLGAPGKRRDRSADRQVQNGRLAAQRRREAGDHRQADLPRRRRQGGRSAGFDRSLAEPDAQPSSAV